MTEFLKMDIFFFVSTLAVVLLTILFAIILWRVSQILQVIERMLGQLADEADSFKEDIDGVRTAVRRGIKKLFSMVAGLRRKRIEEDEE